MSPSVLQMVTNLFQVTATTIFFPPDTNVSLAPQPDVCTGPWPQAPDQFSRGDVEHLDKTAAQAAEDVLVVAEDALHVLGLSQPVDPWHQAQPPLLQLLSQAPPSKWTSPHLLLDQLVPKRGNLTTTEFRIHSNLKMGLILVCRPSSPLVQGVEE